MLIQVQLGRMMNAVTWVAYLPIERIRKAREAFAVMESESQKILEEKRATFEEEGGQLDGTGKDLISILCECHIGVAFLLSVLLTPFHSEIEFRRRSFSNVGCGTTRSNDGAFLNSLDLLPSVLTIDSNRPSL